MVPPPVSTSEQLPNVRLTKRELEIMELTWEGLSAKEIGQRLSISSKTVEFHRVHIRKKLGVDSMISALRYALRTGLIKL